MAKIKQRVINIIRSDERIIFSISQETKSGFRTVEGWLKMNKEDGPLTRISAIEAIKAATGLQEDQIIERAAIAAA